ncbi:MAG: hypothetical protein P8079_03510 [Gammaproteobacteria bacterium]|jgi:hypothetical protein
MFGVFINSRDRLPLGLSILSCFLLLLVHCVTAIADDREDAGAGSAGASSTDDLISTQPGGGGSFLSDLQLSGYLKNETAYRFRVPRTITKIRNIAYLNARYSYSPHLKFNFSGWAYYDLAYGLFDYDTIAARYQRNSSEPLAYLVTLPKEKDLSGADIRELYADMYLGNLDVRLGKQFVVWGVLEGVRITDEINPMDFRELILPDLLDYRIPLWMAKLDYYRDRASYQMLWIPDIRFHKPAPPGSEWELLQEVPGTRYPQTFSYKNSEFGFKVSTDLWDTELTFSYFYTWDDYPVIFRHVLLNQSISPEFFPTYTRISMYGATFVKQLDSYILKGEMAFVTNKYFAATNIDENHDGWLDSNGEFRRNHIRWGLGLDFNWRGADISPSIAQWIILDYNPAIIQDQFDTGINLFVRKEYPESSTIFQLLTIYLVNLKEVYLKPKWTFRITDRFQVSAGLDMFFGKASQFGVSGVLTSLGDVAVPEQRAQFLGNFHDNDRVFMEFKYAF